MGWRVDAVGASTRQCTSRTISLIIREVLIVHSVGQNCYKAYSELIVGRVNDAVQQHRAVACRAFVERTNIVQAVPAMAAVAVALQPPFQSHAEEMHHRYRGAGAAPGACHANATPSPSHVGAPSVTRLKSGTLTRGAYVAWHGFGFGMARSWGCAITCVPVASPFPSCLSA